MKVRFHYFHLPAVALVLLMLTVAGCISTIPSADTRERLRRNQQVHADLQESLSDPLKFASILQTSSAYTLIREILIPEILSNNALAIFDFYPVEETPVEVVETWTREIKENRELIESAITTSRNEFNKTYDTRTGGPASSQINAATIFMRPLNLDHISAFQRIQSIIASETLFAIDNVYDNGKISGYKTCPGRILGILKIEWFGRCEFTVIIHPSFDSIDISRVEVRVVYLQRRDPRAKWDVSSNSELEESSARKLYDSISDKIGTEKDL